MKAHSRWSDARGFGRVKKNAAASEKARLQNKAPAELVALRARRAEATRARRKRIRDSQTAGDLVASKKTAAASEKARQKKVEGI